MVPSKPKKKPSQRLWGGDSLDVDPNNHYISVQRFRVTCLFTGQYDTREYGTIAGVI